MKSFKDLLKEQPTNSGGFPQAYSNAAIKGGPVAGFDPKLFQDPVDDDLLDQGYQTPGESGLAKWRFSNVYPVMKVTLDNNFGDGPSIDAMVDASKEYTDIIGQNAVRSMKKRFSQFMGEAKESPEGKKCPAGEYYCTKRKKCMPIPRGYHLGYRGWLEPDDDNKGKKNGNGSNNGNGNGNGNNGGNGHSSGNGSGGGNGGGSAGGGGE